MISSGLTFGIYPLSAAGTPTGLAVGPKDNNEKIQIALQDLRGGTKTLHPRNYVIYAGPESESKMLLAVGQLVKAGLVEDLTMGCMQESKVDMQSWLEFIRQVIGHYGSHLASLQITNEPNLTFMEGSKPDVLQVLIEGVIAAKKETRKRNLPLKIGFGSVPDSPMAVAHFWENLAKDGGTTFVQSLDFVGHNFYVDVFEEHPLDLLQVPVSVERMLSNLRKNNLVTGGIPVSVPIRVAENGWPTGKNPFANVERSYDRQANVLETIIRTIHRLRFELSISHYELFGLRDADSSKEDLFHQFGIMRDDYSPKPAYGAFKNIIQELGN